MESLVLRRYNHQSGGDGWKSKECAVFMPALCQLSCNLPQYTLFIFKELLKNLGKGIEEIDVFAAQPEMMHLPKLLFADIYASYLLGGLLYKMACKVRPRELQNGMTQRVLECAVEKLAAASENKNSKEPIF